LASRRRLGTIDDDRSPSTLEVIMRGKRWENTDRQRTRRDNDWPNLSDRAFNVLVAALLALSVVIAVLIVALNP
jgi:hypothetical protein